jgi:hypothetical protein
MEDETTSSEVPWYKELFAALDSFTPISELGSFLNVDEYPAWVINVSKELFQQSAPTFPILQLKTETPVGLGLWLGQNCANFYALGELLGMPDGTPEEEINKRCESAVKLVEALEGNKDKPQVKSLLNALEIGGQLICRLPDELPRFEEILHRAFKQALDQPNYNEALGFFQGFAQGLSKKGVTRSGLARATTATPVYMAMYYNWREIDKLKSVTALYLHLQKIGLSKAQLGDIERLRRLCTRVKYHPGKRGRPLGLEK